MRGSDLPLSLLSQGSGGPDLVELVEQLIEFELVTRRQTVIKERKSKRWGIYEEQGKSFGRRGQVTR
jgi:hypothetical protein